MLTVILSLSAALAFAIAAALKHASAAHVPGIERIRLDSLARFVVATVTQRLWWYGTAVDAVAVSLHVGALDQGALAVVQPLLVTALVFGLAIRATSQGGIPRRQLGWAVALCAALAAFLVVAAVSTPVSGADVDRGPAVVAGVVGALVAGVCVWIGRAASSHGVAAAVFGVAAGLCYATTAALLKTLTGMIGPDLTTLGSHWQLYAVAAVGLLGVVLAQMAYQAGPLAASLPAITVVNPLLSIVIGVLVFDEDIRHGVLEITAMLVLLLILAYAVIQLSTLDDGRGNATTAGV